MGRRYWCVPVGFVYRSTDTVMPTRLDLVSRNTCRLLETSGVHLMLEWKLLASSKKAFLNQCCLSYNMHQVWKTICW